MSTVHSSIDQHPDLLALRAGYERAAESTSAHLTFGLTLLTGLYVAASAWIVGFSGTPQLASCNLIVGIAAAFLGYGFATSLDRAHGLTWTVPVLGLWLILSPWILQGITLTDGMIWSNVISGVMLAFLGMTASYFGTRTRATATRT